MLIAIILAHADLVAARRGSRLILLLDEIAAHLDPARRAALYEQLADRSGQVWMTGTDAALFEAVPMRGRADWSVSGGVVRRLLPDTAEPDEIQDPTRAFIVFRRKPESRATTVQSDPWTPAFAGER